MVTPGEAWKLRRAQWRRYRVGRALTYIGFALFLPIGIVSTLVFKTLGWNEDATLWVAALWMMAFAANMVWFRGFRCPDCGKRFFPWGASWLAPSNDWGSKCGHCGARPPA